MKVTLEAWAARHFDPPPVNNTLRIWAREGRIVPAPMKIGRTYFVEQDAKHITEVARAGGLVSRLRAA
jgi:predicted site-specific integrase-resolvase